MGDEQKYFTIQVKGEAMRFAPIPTDAAVMVQTLVSMGAGQNKILKGLMSVLEESSGEEQWDRLTDRVVSREVSLEDIMNVFKRLTERTAKNVQAPVDAE